MKRHNNHDLDDSQKPKKRSRTTNAQESGADQATTSDNGGSNTDAGEGPSTGGAQRPRADRNPPAGVPDSKGYRIEEQSHRRIFGKKLMRRYNGKMAQDTVYTVSITRPEWRESPMLEMESEMREMWADVLSTIRSDNVLPSDLIRIHIAHRDLPKGDIIIYLQQVSTITVDSIMDRIATVLQSYVTLKADDQLEISVGIIRFPRGRGQLKMLNIENDLCKKNQS